MSDDELTPEDERIARALEEDAPTTSKAHDDAVLAAARVAFAVKDAAPADTTASEPASVPRWRSWPIALAAAVALGVALTLLPASDPEPLVDPVLRGGQSSEPVSGSVLRSPPERLRWGRQSLPEQRRVVLRGSDARVLFASEWQPLTNEWTLPADARQRISAAGSYYWSVENKASGAEEFGPFRFDVAE